MTGYSTDLTLRVKLLPRNPLGTLPFPSATEISLTTRSRARAPLPPGNVRLNGQPYATWPSSTTGDVALTWSHRSRANHAPGAPLAAQDLAGTETPEGTLTIEVLLGGVVKRTWTALTGTSQAYTLAQRQADDADATKPVQFRITPISGSLTGTVRTTPTFLMG
jgi:hypothetical protein